MDDTSLVLEETTRNLDHRIELLENHANEAIEVVKINLLILSIVIAAVQFGKIQAETYLYLAGLPLILSIITSIIAYERANPTVGFSKEGVDDLLNEDDSLKDDTSLCLC